MQIRYADGTEADIAMSDIDLLHIVLDSLSAVRRRSAVVECAAASCGTRFLVNTQDFHQVRFCPNHR